MHVCVRVYIATWLRFRLVSADILVELALILMNDIFGISALQ